MLVYFPIKSYIDYIRLPLPVDIVAATAAISWQHKISSVYSQLTTTL